MNDSSMYCLETQDLVAKVMPPILIVAFVLGLPGNLMALWIFCCRLQGWRCNTVYLLNLLLADLFLLVSVPFRIDTLMRGEDWVFGDAWCRINLFMLAVNRSASIAFMTIVAIDRYFMVVHPHHKVNRLTTARARMLAGATWAVVMALRLPLLSEPLYQPHATRNTSLCRSFSSYSNPSPVMKVHYAVYILEFFLPFLILIFCSVRMIFFLRHRQLDKQRRVKRAIQAIMVIVAVFTICFLPAIATGLTSLALQKWRRHDCNAYKLSSQLFSMSIGMTYLNSTLDPLIYCFTSSIFRNTLKSSFNSLGIFNMQLSQRHNSTSEQ